MIFLESFPILAGISDEFDYGGSVSLDMRNGIRGFNFLVKIIKFGTNIELNMVINISYRFCHKPGKMLAKLLCVFKLCTLKIIVHIHIFSRVISNATRIFIALSLRRVRSWRFCLIKYVHNGPFYEPINFGIPELMFQVEVIKFGANVGPNMLINTRSGFYYNREIFLSNPTRIFPFCTLKITVTTLTSTILLRSF